MYIVVRTTIKKAGTIPLPLHSFNELEFFIIVMKLEYRDYKHPKADHQGQNFNGFHLVIASLFTCSPHPGLSYTHVLTTKNPLYKNTEGIFDFSFQVRMLPIHGLSIEFLFIHER